MTFRNWIRGFFRSATSSGQTNDAAAGDDLPDEGNDKQAKTVMLIKAKCAWSARGH